MMLQIGLFLGKIFFFHCQSGKSRHCWNSRSLFDNIQKI